MGWDATRMLRFYPLVGDLRSIEIERIVESISNTAASLSNEIVYSVNPQENCYDLKFNSSKLSGDVIFNRRNMDVWDFVSHGQGATMIGNITNMGNYDGSFYNSALFTFDKIIVRGNLSKLDWFYQEFFPIFKHSFDNRNITKTNREISLNMVGFYTAINQHDTGNYERRMESGNRSHQITQEEYLKPIRVYDIFEEVIPKENFSTKLKKLSDYFKEFEYENVFEGLETISFSYKNQVVKKIDWIEKEDQLTKKRNGSWVFTSCDSWQNCVNPEWKEFCERKMKAGFKY